MTFILLKFGVGLAAAGLPLDHFVWRGGEMMMRHQLCLVSQRKRENCAAREKQSPTCSVKFKLVALAVIQRMIRATYGKSFELV